MRTLLPVALSFALLSTACGGAVPPPRAVVARDFWQAMTTRLPGTWQASTDGRTVSVRYRVVSRGSALLETFVTASGTETVSVYHPDGDGLMVTHYCAQGNQPRLRAVAAEGDHARFERVDATSVTADQSVMTELEITLADDHFDQTSVYVAPDGTRETTVLHFERVADAP